MNIGIEGKNLNGMGEKISQIKIVIEKCISIGLKKPIGVSILRGMVTSVTQGGITKTSGGASRWNFSGSCDRFVKETI